MTIVKDDFCKAFDLLIYNEGGFVDNPNDAGGATKYGISQRSYPDVDIANLTLEEAKEIYKRDYWRPSGADRFMTCKAVQVFDAAVMEGVHTAVKRAQSVVNQITRHNIAEDGIVGPNTLQAVQNANAAEFAYRYADARLDYLQQLDDWLHFGEGWQTRVMRVLAYAALQIEERHKKIWFEHTGGSYE